MNASKQTESRHGKRADGKTQTSVTLREDLLSLAREAAAADGRSFSNWLERLMLEKLPGLPPTQTPTKPKRAAKQS